MTNRLITVFIQVEVDQERPGGGTEPVETIKARKGGGTRSNWFTWEVPRGVAVWKKRVERRGRSVLKA